MKPHRMPTSARTKAASRGRGGPRYVSFALAATAVYGDLLKRVMSGTEALVALYAISAAILAVMITTGRRAPHAPVPLISRLSLALTLTYLLQFLTGFDVELLPALMMLTYMAIPLAFIVIMPRAYPEFDLRALALFTTILMVPIHAVGLVQQFVDSSFMVSTAYSETGGVIARNFLEGTGSFNRLPSLFASADRYAGVSLLQVLLSFLLLEGAGPNRRSSMVLLTFALLSGAAGMILAGARSRILITCFALVVGGITLLIAVNRGRLTAHGRANLARAALVACLFMAGAMSFEQVRDRVAELPIFLMLAQTVGQGDVQSRVGQGFDVSAMPNYVKFFGEGLGTSAGGRPGEFGIRAMWIEGGFFWTTIMLVIHAAILFVLARSCLRTVLKGSAVLSLLMAAAGALWLNGLMAGFASSFELSTALLLFPLIAVVSMEAREPIERYPTQHRWMQ